MHSHLEESIRDAEGKDTETSAFVRMGSGKPPDKTEIFRGSPTELYGCVGARISSDAP
jgi:hypothetical protein